MESVAHSRQPNKVSVTVSKKLSNGSGNGGFLGKTLYDEVYGGVQKFAAGNSLSPRFEDYGEIFASFHAPRASSIPVLDLPAVYGGEVFFDLRNAGFDYGEVFGGFDGLDFWLSYKDLFRQGASEQEEKDDDDEAWSPVETNSFSGDLDQFGNNQDMPIGDHLRTVDESTEFNILYHKVNGITGNEDMSNGKSQSQLHAVPGFTRVHDVTTHFQRADPSLQVVDDVDLDVEFNASKAMRNHLRKMGLHPCDFTLGEQVLGSDLPLHDGCSKNGSHSGEMFITVSDISLRTIPSKVPPPSRPPPEVDAKKGHASGFHSNNEQVDSEEALGDSSPPFFDVEVDTNSSAAAMKDVMHRPETKHRSARELKERKKVAVSESNVNSSYDVKDNEAKMSVNITRFNGVNVERMPTTCNQSSSEMKIYATDERQKARKVASGTLELSEWQRLLNMFEEKHMKESRSSEESDRSTGAGTWKEATEFFELVGVEESGKVIQPINHIHTKKMVQDTRTCEHGKKEREAANIQEEYKMVKAIVEGYQLEECKKKSKSGNGAYEQGKNIRRSKSCNDESGQREHVKNDEMTEIFELEKNEKARIVRLNGKSEKTVTKADLSVNLRELPETQCKEPKRGESERSKEVVGQILSEIQWSMKHMTNEKKLKEDEEQQLSMKRLKQSQEKKENGKFQREAPSLGATEGEQMMKISLKPEKIERSNEALNLDSPEETVTYKRENEIILELANQVQNKKGLKEACENDEFERSLKVSSEKEVSDEGIKHDLEQVEKEKGLEDFKPEMNEKRTELAFEQGENEASEIDQCKEKFDEICDGYRKGNRQKDVGDRIGVQKVLKQDPELEMNSGNEAQRKKDIGGPSDQAFDREGSVGISNVEGHSEQSERILKEADKNRKDRGLDKSLEQMERNGEGINKNFTEEINETCATEIDENLLAAPSLCIHEENIGKQEASQECIADQEIGKSGTDSEVGEKKLEKVRVENQMHNGKERASEMSQGEAADLGKVDYTVTAADELNFSCKQAFTENTKTDPHMEFPPQNQERKIGHESGERGKTKQHVNVALDPEERRAQMSSTQADLSGDCRGNTVADEPATLRDAVNIQKTSQRAHVSPSTKSKEKSLNETLASVDKGADRIRRERELGKDHLRKIEVEMERERERRKDRIAVDRAMLEAEREREREKDRRAVDKATFEARDRAYAEARERTERAAFERATAEARQRALAEARERLEKACADARDKTHGDKAAAEAKLKAERAAVERATAEARERAMEKVKIERAAFESRERLERSVSDKFSVSLRSDGRQGSSSSDMLDPHFQNSSSSTHSKYPYSSVYGASSFSERSEREGESAQRCRARLERYRRTSERAAKALEEKNMRDLVAQKEQAERNRLAETLDTEVRRWSSGKEGNLRALLSTLQYILGPDSGWQPIPLTEVITSAAVKKAYRKATLCVHPDKLQQRGASIQHKYTCEKVFDLLKEAWNKFNSEER